MPFTTHHAAVLVCTIAVAFAASPLLFGSRPSHGNEESFPTDDGLINQGSTGGLSDAPTVSPGSAQLHVQHVEGLMSDINILLVLDPNFFLCWESILIDETTKDTLLPWVSSLRDVFTSSSESPAGLDLEV